MRSLRIRIVAVFVLGLSAVFGCVGALSFHSMLEIQKGKYVESIQNALTTTVGRLDATLLELKRTSLVLSFEGSVGAALYSYMTAEAPYDRLVAMSDMSDEIALMISANSDLGYIMYHRPAPAGEQVIYQSFTSESALRTDHLPHLYTDYRSEYFGPHASVKRFSDRTVLSVNVRMQLSELGDVYLYIESAHDVQETILTGARLHDEMRFVLLDDAGSVTFSELDSIQAGDTFAVPGGDSALVDGCYCYHRRGAQGYSLLAMVPVSVHDAELYSWYTRFLTMFAVFAAVSVVAGAALWRMADRPLKKLDKEIDWIRRANFLPKVHYTKTSEFDQVLQHFEEMKAEILGLIEDAIKREKHKSQLEIEKLMYQINPHFLMNALDTIHWMAVGAGETEINRVVMALNRLLLYNLGKLNPGPFSSLEAEVDAIRQYLTLQQVRYDFSYRIDCDEGADEIPMPRFILQPLVENAIKHGLSDDAAIDIKIRIRDVIHVEIRDNGPGMSSDQLARLFDREGDKGTLRMGIGLDYVKKTLDSIYEGKAQLKIESELGVGTKVTLVIPAIMKGDEGT